MIELTIPVYAISLGFIAGSWDREYQQKSARGWENKSLGQTSKAVVRTNDPSFESEKPRPEGGIALTALSVPDASQLSGETVILSEVKTCHKGVEFAEKGK
jgi:hypothetical protein